LRNNFIVVSGNVEQFGVNIPATDLKLDANGNKTLLNWGDANDNMSHYLSVLATEYRLLKNNGQNYKETIKELYYALLALERLDLYSEYSIRYRDNVGYWYNGAWIRGYVDNTTDCNGWWIRDDISQGFWNNNYLHFGFSNIDYNNFKSIFKTDNMESISQDNIYHLLEGLSLIRKLLDNEYVGDIPVTYVNQHIPNRLNSSGILTGGNCNFSLWAKKITDRMIRMMQHPSPQYPIYLFHEEYNPYNCYFEETLWNFLLPGIGSLIYTFESAVCNIDSRWYIKHPSGYLAEEGAGDDFDTYYFYSYGLARAGNWISVNDQYHFNNSDNTLHEDVFFKLLNGNYNGAVNSVNNSLSSLFNLLNPQIYANVNGKIVKNGPVQVTVLDKYDDYKTRSLATVANVGGLSTFNILRDKRPDFPYEHFPLIWLALHKDEYSNIYLPNSSDYQTDKVYYENRLNSAPCSGPRSYNIPNDYSLDWSYDSRLVWPERCGQLVNEKHEFCGLDYMLLHNLYCLAYSQDFRKLTVKVVQNYTNQTTTENAVDLIASNTITGGNISYQASHSIKFISGFKTTSGTAFKAQISPTSIDYTGYSQSNPCNSLKSAQIFKTISYFDQTRNYSIDELEAGIKNIKIEQKENNLLLDLETKTSNDFNIYPNPNKGSFSIAINSIENRTNTLQIKNSLGVLIFTYNFTGNNVEINLPNISKGLYFLTVISENKQFQSKLIIE
jgi:hypothetical protein